MILVKWGGANTAIAQLRWVCEDYIVILQKCFSPAKNNIVLINVLKQGVSEGMLPQEYI